MPVTLIRSKWETGDLVFTDTSETEIARFDASAATLDVKASRLAIGGTAVTVTAAEINAMAGTGLSATELGYLDTVVAGTVTASKALVVGANKNVDVLAIADSGLKLGSGAGTAVDATAAELNQAADLSTRVVAGGAALTVTLALHNGRLVLLDTLAGTVCTLPAASGTGARFTFVISVIATSNSHIVKVANASDTMYGIILAESDDAADVAKAFIGSGTDDTITLNRTTTGSVAKGEWIEAVDIATNLWWIRGVVAQNGTEATPFSATV